LNFSVDIMSRTRLLGGALAVLFSLHLASPSVFAAPTRDGYTGSKGCGECHAKISTDWQDTKHARAFADLRKSGQEDLPACVPCHVTGHGQPGGFVDREITPQLTGVQCEACHGAGSRHVASQGAERLVAAPSVEVCRLCHTPTQDPRFDYPEKIRGVHGVATASLKPGKACPLAALPDHFDFGAINEGTPASTTVTVQNTGDRAITVTNVRTN
jgi:hypothetical protein